MNDYPSNIKQKLNSIIVEHVGASLALLETILDTISCVSIRANSLSTIRCVLLSTWEKELPMMKLWITLTWFLIYSISVRFQSTTQSDFTVCFRIPFFGILLFVSGYYK